MSKKSGALLVGLGIFLSKISGLLRERAFAYYFGNSDAGDAFKAALKIPNFLQNLFGEGVLSASFIPVYANTLAQEYNQQKKDQDKQLESTTIALTIGALLFLITALLVIIGIVSTPFLINTIAPGFKDEKRELTIKLVQIFFPGTGFVVMSAWCLGILNSHRKFFLSYVAPVVWNLAIISVLLFYGHSSYQYDLAIKAGWGLVLGSFLQVFIQIPTTLKLLKLKTLSINVKLSQVGLILRNFVPSVVSRGVVQVSSYIDNILASLLPSGAVSNLAFAQTLYLLPISLFGMSISASELPEMSSLIGTKVEIYQKLRLRLQNAIKRVCFFIIPSVCAFILLGDVVIAALYQTGKFTEKDTHIVWIVLIGSSVGLLASTIGRLYSSTFYSLKDTKTTLNFAIVRIFFTTILGYIFAFKLAPMISPDSSFATAGLTASAGLAGWIEYILLKSKLNTIIGKTDVEFLHQLKLWACAILSAAISFIIKFLISNTQLSHPLPQAVIVISVYGSSYFLLTYLFKIEVSIEICQKIIKKITRST